MSKNFIPETPSVNIIGSGTDIVGDINSSGDLRIDGTIKGTIIASGKIVIGPSGKVDGKIKCQNAEVSGNVKAHFEVKDLLSLRSTAIVSGDILTNKLAIEPEAVFSGACKMGNPMTENDNGVEPK